MPRISPRLRRNAIGDGVRLDHVADHVVEARLLHGAAQHEAVAAHHPGEVVAGKALAQTGGIAEMGAEVELVRLEAEGFELDERVVDLGAIDFAGGGGSPVIAVGNDRNPGSAHHGQQRSRALAQSFRR
jgi:hypothetical protein